MVKAYLERKRGTNDQGNVWKKGKLGGGGRGEKKGLPEYSLLTRIPEQGQQMPIVSNTVNYKNLDFERVMPHLCILLKTMQGKGEGVWPQIS